MSETICCFRCGESLDYLSLPLSRRDECRACQSAVHVCRMCIYYDKDVLQQCLEDDAEEVKDKEKVNFCEWFKPAFGAFDPEGAEQAARAKSSLDALFSGDRAIEGDADTGLDAAEDLFK